MTAWLGVASAEHVARGVTYLRGDRIPLRQFTAICVLPDEDVWQADEVSASTRRDRAERR